MVMAFMGDFLDVCTGEFIKVEAKFFPTLNRSIFIKNLDKRTSYNITDIVMEYHRKSRSLTKDLIKLGYQVYDKNKFFWKKQGILHATKSP